MVTYGQGSMTPGQLGTYLKGYFQRSAQVTDLSIQKAGILTGVFPTRNLSIPKLEVRYTQGVPGRMNVALDAPVEDSRWSYRYKDKDLTYDKFSFSVTDAATDMVQVDNMAADGVRSGNQFFANVRDFRMVTELLAKVNASNTHAAAAVWSDAAADVEGDIVRGLEGIVQRTGINPATTKFGLLYQSKVMRGIDQLALIKNVQQTLKSYLGSVFNLGFYPYTPYMDPDGNKYLDVKELTSSDALLTNALIFVEGPQTMECGQYAPNGVPMFETTRVHDVGYKTTLRHSFGCLAVPRYDDTTYTTPLLYKITAASSA
jgi:hypothetical protein